MIDCKVMILFQRHKDYIMKVGVRPSVHVDVKDNKAGDETENKTKNRSEKEGLWASLAVVTKSNRLEQVDPDD